MKLTKENISTLTEWLDERYSIFQELQRKEDALYYDGAIKAIEIMGIDWNRDIYGKHTLFI